MAPKDFWIKSTARVNSQPGSWSNRPKTFLHFIFGPTPQIYGLESFRLSNYYILDHTIVVVITLPSVVRINHLFRDDLTAEVGYHAAKNFLNRS
jgi:hypothetical protein